MRKALALGTTAACLTVLAVSAAPASAAACTADQTLAGTCTTVSVTVVNGTLSLAVAGVGVAGTSGAVSATLGSTLDVALGATTVTDARLSPAAWSAKATGSPLELTGQTAIPVTAQKFFVSAVATPPAAGTFDYPSGTGAGEEAVASGATLVTASAGGTAIYTPSLRVSVPAAQPAGVYVGAVVQSLV